MLYFHGFNRIGGAEYALLRLMDAIRPMAVEPLAVWPRKDAALEWLVSRGVPVVRLKVPHWRHGLSLPLLPLLLARLRGVVARGNIDLVHVNNYRSAPFGRLVSRWAGVPCVCHVRELISPKKIRQYRLQGPDALVAVCDAVAGALVDGGVPKDRVTAVRSGIPIHAVAPEDEPRTLRETLGIRPDDLVVGIVAHILPHKGYDDLVRALALITRQVPHLRCLIVGEAPRRRYLRRLYTLAERVAVRDKLILVGPQEDIPRFLNAMDVFVLPSLTEGLPLTVLEAMAAGKPVVATAVGGIPEAVRHGETGFIVPPGDPRRLAEAAMGLLKAPTTARAMGQAGRERVEEFFTLGLEASQTLMIYRKILTTCPSDPARDSSADGSNPVGRP